MNNNFFNKMERKLSKYAIHNITLYLIVCYSFGYLIQVINSDFIQFITLEPGFILKGQIWRIVTWIIIPPPTINIFFTLLMLYFYYSIGQSLEHVWGTYQLNLYFFSGMVFTVLGSIVLYIILAGLGINVTGLGYMFSTYYVNMSLFLAYAATFPEAMVLLLVIPIKVKFLGIVYGILILVEGIQSFSVGALYGMARMVVIGASLLNFVIFFITQKKGRWRSPKQIKRQMEYRHVTKTASQNSGTDIAKHKCAVCGRTSESNPELEFRFCSKCNGNYEYCSDHLFTHEHVK